MKWMQLLSPALKRALIPTCPPTRPRLAAWGLVATFAAVLLNHGLPIPEMLIVLGAVSAIAAGLAAPASRPAAHPHQLLRLLLTLLRRGEVA